MSKDEIKKGVITLIVQQIPADGVRNMDEITPEKHLRDDLGMDSLDEIELIMACEKQFDLSIPDGEAELVTTVQQMIDTVEKHLPKS